MNEWLLLHWQTSLSAFVAGALLSAAGLSVQRQRQRKKQQALAEELQRQQADLDFQKALLKQTQEQNDSLQQAFSASQEQMHRAQRIAAAQQAELKHISQLQQQIQAREQALEESRQQHQAAERALAELKARQQSEQQHYQEQLQLLRDNKAQLKTEFSELANEIFDQKQQRFNEQSQASVSALLEPFNKQIEQFRKRVDDIHTEDTASRSQLLTQLSMLKDMNSQLHKQAGDLTKALQGDKKLQGSWGELQVERILQSAGLQKDREYQREANFKDDRGNNNRPDFIIYLPDGKHLIVDSKVSLNAYQRTVAADDEATRNQALREHVMATRHHIRSLGAKDYPRLNGLNTPDFVLMFMPIESAFIAAFETEPKLFNEAFEQHIVVVTPSTLLATLRTVANLWVLERQNENAKELYSLAGKIFDKFVIFSEKMSKLGQQLRAAEKTYDDALGSLSDGRGSMVSYVQRLKDIGAPTQKSIADALLPKEQSTDQREHD